MALQECRKKGCINPLNYGKIGILHGGGRNRGIVHCKKNLSYFPSPAGMSLTKTLPGRELLNYSLPGRDWLVTSRLGTGKTITFFTVYSIFLINAFPFGKPLKASGKTHSVI